MQAGGAFLANARDLPIRRLVSYWVRSEGLGHGGTLRLTHKTQSDWVSMGWLVLLTGVERVKRRAPSVHHSASC